MTTTVQVNTRAFPATVTLSGGTQIQVEPHAERRFQVTGTDTISVVENSAAEENPRPFKDEKVPGAEQNDKLVKPVKPGDDPGPTKVV